MANHVGKVIKSTLASVMVVAMVPTLSLAETVGDGEDLVAAAEPVVQGPSIDENEADLVSEATATQQPLSDELLISEVDAAEDEPTQSEAAAKPERWTPPANAARDAWYKHSDGTWSYVNANGAAALGWKKLSGKWYYLDPETTKAALWEKTIDGKRYYFNESNQMVTGWLQWGHDKSWSYYDASGAMASGWRKVGGKWYYLDPQTGKAALWEKTIDGKRYYFDGSNAMVTGWLKYKDGSWSYYNSDGAAAVGWKKLGGKWYYLDPNTTRAALWEKTIDGKRYYFDGSNAMVTGWLKYKDGSWSYYNSDGAAATGWKKLSGKWYYLDPETTRMSLWSRTIDGKDYYFDASGAMHTGWLQWNDDKLWSYYYPSGERASGTQTIDGTRYTFDANGKTNQAPFPTITGDRTLDQQIYTKAKQLGSLSACFNGVKNHTHTNWAGKSHHYSYGNYNLNSSWVIAEAKRMMNGQTTDCYAYAATFACMAKALGYNAQCVAGALPLRSGGVSYHGWVVIYQNGGSYVYDPNLAHSYPMYNFYKITYGSAPLTYIR